MQFHHTIFALPLLVTLFACIAEQDESPAADPLASFERMVSGEWRMTVESGTSQYSTWDWGPGRHSMRMQTAGSGAAGEPWRALRVVYWHPGRKQICLLGLSPFRRGVSEGTMRFEGEAADAVFDLYQTGGRREMRWSWAFDGPDRYHEVLLESTGGAGFTPLGEWEFVRSATLTVPPPRATEEAPAPSRFLEVLLPLVGHTWEARGERPSGDAFHIQSTFEWVPHADFIQARSFELTGDDRPSHLFDLYLYHHTGDDVLRCLALSRRGGVFEGDVTGLEGGALQFELSESRGDRTTPYRVRLEFEGERVLRQRVWSVAGGESRLLLDVDHERRPG